MFTETSQEMTLTVMDYFVVALIFLVYIVRNYIRHRSMRDRMDSGEAGVLMLEYNDTLRILWGGALLILCVWYWAGRSLAGLGIFFDYSTPNLVGWAVAIVVSLVLAAQVREVGRNPKAAESVRNHLKNEPGVMRIMPTTRQEYSRFQFLSVTAGITEEIIFRAYLIWFFSFWMPVWWAALVALAVFTGAHLYQESAKSVLKVAAIGVFLTAAYLLSGSLLVAIVLHIVVDLTSGASVRRAMQGA